jgi:hypothetical protein
VVDLEIDRIGAQRQTVIPAELPRTGSAGAAPTI